MSTCINYCNIGKINEIISYSDVWLQWPSWSCKALSCETQLSCNYIQRCIQLRSVSRFWLDVSVIGGPLVFTRQDQTIESFIDGYSSLRRARVLNTLIVKWNCSVNKFSTRWSILNYGEFGQLQISAYECIAMINFQRLRLSFSQYCFLGST